MYVFGAAVFVAALFGGGYLSELAIDEFSRATNALVLEIGVAEQHVIAGSHHMAGTIAMVGAVGTWLFGLTASLGFVMLGRGRSD
jgi:hypothetical protein